MVAFPDVPYAKGLPKLVRTTSVSRAGKRFMAAIETVDPFWQIDVETAPLARELIPGMRAFIDECNSAIKTIVWTPSYLDVPQAYLADPGNVALADDGNLVSGTGGLTIAVNGVTNGLDLRRGDMISMIKDEYRSMHTVMTGAVASSNTVTLVIEPYVPTYITAGAVVKFKNLELNVRMGPDSGQMTDDYLPVASLTLVEVPK
ncbi:hypothetical protein [Mesorhizobium australicum]|uniref:hypothetical protein n=1 Tax=Mesorhizobium australicum TaxID=536018 RepID=UPI003335A504